MQERIVTSGRKKDLTNTRTILSSGYDDQIVDPRRPYVVPDADERRQPSSHSVPHSLQAPCFVGEYPGVKHDELSAQRISVMAVTTEDPSSPVENMHVYFGAKFGTLPSSS